MANGVRADRWTPKGTTNFKLPPILSPLESVKDEILVLTGLSNRGAFKGDGHYVKTSGWLTGTTITKTTGSDINCNGTSMDQVAAAQIGGLKAAGVFTGALVPTIRRRVGGAINLPLRDARAGDGDAVAH